METDPTLHLRIHFLGRSLNFSQLPEGVQNCVGWLADFMMRQDLVKWDPSLKGRRPGILMLDEVDAHLHPRWQRSLLPALQKALPDVQIIVSSHSPFVISSCPGSKVHVLDVNASGEAHARPPQDAPVGESVAATLKDIFDVSSQFDIETEQQLNEWNELKKQEAAGILLATGKRKLERLTGVLSGKNEELRLIVSASPKLSGSLLDTLTARKPARRGKKAPRNHQRIAG